MRFTKKQVEEFSKNVINKLNDIVFNNIYNYIEANPRQRKYLNPAFPFPKELRIGILKEQLAIEYIGPEQKKSNDFETTIIYNETYDLYDFLELDIFHLNTPSLEIDESIHNMNFFLGKSIEYLCDYFYDFTQIREDFIINGFIDLKKVRKPVVLNNCTFFYTDRNDGLKIRHIDLLEVFPLLEEGIPFHDDASLVYLSNYIVTNKFPAYDVDLHGNLNEFIGLINLASVKEPQITKYIEEHPELLQIAFGFNKLNPQKNLIWQDRSNRDNLKPDFLPEDMSGFCNILDFKLPYLKTKPIVGKTERKHPSYEIDECIAQLDTYEEYCNQYANRIWLENQYLIKIDSPQRYIIMGHSKDFTPEDRQKLRKIRNTTFFTYDEFIEMARYQIYRIR